MCLAGDIPPAVADQIRDLAREWARSCGEVSPSVQAVATTHREALAYIHDDPGSVNTYLAGPELATPVYLVVLEGEFDYRPDDEHAVAGRWAVLLFERDTLTFRVHTVRPEGYIPSLDLRQVGRPHRL
jgi:hypothetical protein